MKKIKFGTVADYNVKSKTGTIAVDSDSLIPFGILSIRNITAGFSEPIFAQFTPKQSGNPPGWLHAKDIYVRVGDQVVLNIEVSYRLEVAPNRRILRRSVQITDWAFASAYADAWKIILARPKYKIVEFTLYNGVPTSSENQRVVIAEGTALELQARYPRCEKNDPWAPEKKCLGFTYRRRFYKRGFGGEFAQCADPRALPWGQSPEKFQPTNEQGVLLATGTEIAMGLGWKPSPRQMVTAI